MRIINAAAFWDLYFANDFRTLERHADGYRGLVVSSSGPSPSGKGLLDKRAPAELGIAMNELVSYAYAADPRFALLTARPTEPDAAISAIVDKTYPYRDAAPFGKQRMADLFAGELFVPTNVQRPPGQTVISLDMLERALSAMVDAYRDELAQPLAALAWLLGELRMRSSARSLLAVVRNAPFVPFAKHSLPSVVVDAALSALWKVNDKSVLPDLIELMNHSEGAARRKIAPLFERLLSAGELLSIERCGDDYFRPSFWQSVLAGPGTSDAAIWNRLDTRSLFWEIRHLAARRLAPDERAALSVLTRDEVGTVADVAKKRLSTR